MRARLTLVLLFVLIGALPPVAGSARAEEAGQQPAPAASSEPDAPPPEQETPAETPAPPPTPPVSVRLPDLVLFPPVVQRFAEQPEGRYLLDEDKEQKARSAMVGGVVAKALGDMSPDAQANYYRLMQAGADTLCQRKALFDTVYGSILSGLAEEGEEPGEAYQTEGITCKFSPRFPGRPALLVQYQNTNESFGSFGTLLELALVDTSGKKVLVAGAKVAGPGARQSTLSQMAAHILKCFETYSGLSEEEIRALVDKQEVHICSPVVPYTLEY